MPVALTARGVNDMSLDDVLITLTLGGLLLSGTYIRAGFRESRRERDLQMRRSERVSNVPRSGQTEIHEMGN